MTSLNQVLSNKEQTTFNRHEVLTLAKRAGIRRSEVIEFLSNPDNRIARGQYKPQPTKITQETDQEIEQRINERFEILETLATAAASNCIRSLIISGPPGLGKTHTITTATEKICNNIVHLTGSASAIGLFRALHATQHEGSLLVIDDCDSVFFDLDALSLLKAACDSTKTRTIQWNTEYAFKGDEIETEFLYQGTVIFITNIDFDTELSKKSKLTPHLEALMSRSHYLSLGIHNKRDYLIRIKTVLKTMLKGQARLDIIDFIDNNADRLRELSCRTAVKLHDLRNNLPEHWESIARITLCK